MDKLIIRPQEKSDMDGLRNLYQQEQAYSGTLQLPYQPESLWQSRWERSGRDGVYQYVAEINDQVAGHLFLDNFPNVRRRHAGVFGIAVHDDYQGQGVGTALMETMIDLADNWLNLRRIELTVYVDNEAAIALL